MYIHLTNVAIQKNAAEYNPNHGGKWSIRDLRLYVESVTGSRAATDGLFRDLEQIIVVALKSVQHSIINEKHCFELYGVDVLIDGNLKPWLLECNASPSLVGFCDSVVLCATRTLVSIKSPLVGGTPRLHVSPTRKHADVVFQCVSVT